MGSTILLQYPFEIFICVVAGVFFLWQVIDLYCNEASLWRWFVRMKKEKVSLQELEQPVSIIVYVEDNKEELSLTLPALLRQKYDQFEVIVVNDGKTAEIKNYVSSLQQVHSNLYQTYVPKNTKSLSQRKLAMTIGVKAAHYEWIATTEAGMLPDSDYWLKASSFHFADQIDLVLGYSNFISSKSMWNRYIAYDEFREAVTYLTASLHGNAYKGNGGNLFYRRSLFFSKNGFRSHLNLKWGEDDLFVNELAAPNNTRICCVQGAAMRRMTPSRASWHGFKHRYASSARFYRKKLSWIRRIYPVSFYGFYFFDVLLLLSLFVSHWAFFCLGILLLISRNALMLWAQVKTAHLLNEPVGYFSWLCFEFVRPLVNLYFRCGRFKHDYIGEI